MKKFNIAYIVDDDIIQIDMLQKSINTLLKFNKVDNIYIMYYNIDENILKSKLSNYNVNIEYFLFDISLVDKYFPELPNVTNKRLRYPSLSRFFISEVIPYDNFWYIDTDILFNANIRSLFLRYQNNKLFYAFNRKNYNSKDYPTSYINVNAINAGILYINCKLFNELKLFKKILSFYKNNSLTIKYVNQSGYAYLFEIYYKQCYIKISDIINVRPLYNNDEQINNVKIFHCNGASKNLFDITYNKIMGCRSNG